MAAKVISVMGFTTSPVLGLLVSASAIYLLGLNAMWSCIALLLGLNLKMMPLAHTVCHITSIDIDHYAKPTPHMKVQVAPSLARLLLLPAPQPKSDSLLHVHSTKSRTCIMECDVYFHKSNSTYLVDIDVSRAELLSRLFAHALRRIPRSGIVLGGVDILFRRELRPLEAFDVRSCILTWDRKWIYVLSYHIRPGVVIEGDDDWLSEVFGKGDQARGKKGFIFAVAISKYVAKSGGRTVPPADILEASGYELADAVEARRIHGLELLYGK